MLQGRLDSCWLAHSPSSPTRPACLLACLLALAWQPLLHLRSSSCSRGRGRSCRPFCLPVLESGQPSPAQPSPANPVCDFLTLRFCPLWPALPCSALPWLSQPANQPSSHPANLCVLACLSLTVTARLPESLCRARPLSECLPCPALPCLPVLAGRQPRPCPALPNSAREFSTPPPPSSCEFRHPTQP